MPTALDQQIEELGSATLDLQDFRATADAADQDKLDDLLDRLRILNGRAVIARRNGQTDPIELDEEVKNVIATYLAKKKNAEFNDLTRRMLDKAVQDAGAKTGAGEFFSADRVIEIDGQPHLRLKDGTTAPISASVIRNELPATLLNDRRAKHEIELDDLREQISEKEREVSKVQQDLNRVPGDNGLLVMLSRKRKELAALKQRRDGIKQERHRDVNPEPPKKQASAAQLGQLASLRNAMERTRDKARANPANHLLVEASRARREYESYLREVGGN